MRRLAALLALLLAAPLAAQSPGAAYKLDQVAVRLDGGAGGAGFSTPASCTTAGMVPIFLGSPVAMGCDAGLTYDAATDTLTSGRILVGDGGPTTPGFAFASAPTAGWYTGGGGSWFLSVANNPHMAFNYSNNGVMGVSRDGAFAFSSDQYNPTSLDTYLTRGAAATPQLGAAASATPVAQTLQAQGGAGSNIAGQPWVRKGSLATGTADSGAIIEQTGYTAGATTTAHVASTRSQLSPKWTALTGGSATGFATLTYGASMSIGAEFFVTIRAGDGTNRQGMSYRVAVNSVRDAAGNTQSVVAVVGTPPVAAGSGTLTAAFTVTEGAGAVTINCNAVSSLTETFLDANFQTIANGPGLTIAPL